MNLKEAQELAKKHNCSIGKAGSYGGELIFIHYDDTMVHLHVNELRHMDEDDFIMELINRFTLMDFSKKSLEYYQQEYDEKEKRKK